MEEIEAPLQTIAVGRGKLCGINDGTVLCGQLGSGDGRDVPELPSAFGFTQLSLGESRCGISEHDLHCWGAHSVGPLNAAAGFDHVATQMESNDVSPYRVRPRICGVRRNGKVQCWPSLRSPKGTFTAITRHCGVTPEGEIACWAGGLRGKRPKVAVTAIDTSSTRGCGLDAEGSIVCWGKRWPPKQGPPEGKFEQVVVGEDHGCALAKGEYRCWGDNEFGQTWHDPELKDVKKLYAGPMHTCAITEAGLMTCWGGAWATDPGEETGLCPAEAVEGQFKDMARGPAESCALGIDGKVTCVGYVDTVSQCYRAVHGGPFKEVGERCALRADGSLECWWQQGAVIAPEGRYAHIAGNCGLALDGTVTCWDLRNPPRSFRALKR